MFTSINQVDTCYLTPREICIPLGHSIPSAANFHDFVVICTTCVVVFREPADATLPFLEPVRTLLDSQIPVMIRSNAKEAVLVTSVYI